MLHHRKSIMNGKAYMDKGRLKNKKMQSEFFSATKKDDSL